jgi:hypothetical protein
METIEIRQNKKTLIPMLVLLLGALIATTYYVYFSGKYDGNIIMKVLYVFLSAILFYAIYFPAKKFFKNEPVLTLSKSEITINEKGKPVSFLWAQINDWKIEKDSDGGTQYLIINASALTKKINISWLEKRPSEIEELIYAYKN